eukprot:CAMPEP_0185251316 /NCGR_PEP_ID=MMETSP1359-20130426/727_1 /TAXON_ID=552665 /ORGANISM="Bigelowiella longifila, Strain CCMP242" /LENGTH=65 /DNA_ID=CAMNT_0027833153 /DNA_START=9 /DNA_END=203 /DNA_ORIENTATION=-
MQEMENTEEVLGLIVTGETAMEGMKEKPVTGETAMEGMKQKPATEGVEKKVAVATGSIVAEMAVE